MSAFGDWLSDSILLKTDAVPVALNQTLQLVFVPFIFVVLFGIPLGVVLFITSPGGLSPIKWLNSTLGVIVNVTRSLPFLVLVIALWPPRCGHSGVSSSAHHSVPSRRWCQERWPGEDVYPAF